MPRTIRDANLETRTARARLRVAHKPYYRLLEPGLHLGYRKLASGPGTWVVRRYDGEGRYSVANLRTPDGDLILADDYADADGARVMSFSEAQHVARGPRAARTVGGLTVADAVAGYLEYLAGDGRPASAHRDVQCRAEALILPKLGSVKVAALTPDRLRRWRDEIVALAPRLRTRPDAAQNYGKLAGDEEARRRRRASANRTWTTLRAALNHAFRDGKVETDGAWRKVRPLRNTDAVRSNYLTITQARRLVNACSPEFRRLVQGALQTGARYGELARLHVRDFNADAGTLAIRQSKSGKARHVVLTDEGIALFTDLCAGRQGGELVFTKGGDGAWLRSYQCRPMAAACERAKITPPIGFHGLRHTWASLATMNGVPLLVIARNLGHADTRMVERHYGHLAPSYVSDAIRKGAPRFGMIGRSNLRPLQDGG